MKEAVAIVPLEQQRLGRYRLLYRIASGGMASVYLARLAGSGGFEKLVAIKRIHEHLTEDEDFVNMFVDEARLAAQLSHPNIVSVLELGNEGNAHYMAMEYVNGESLLALVRNTQPPLQICARIIAQAAAGLHAAHELRDRQGELLGVIHRDVSPQNILLSYDGAVKVADFGVARARGNLHVTAIGNVKGKFAYMAPEQARRKPLDRRVDIFALGIVLFEICTRHRLFKGQTEADSIAKVLSLEVPKPSSKDKDFPPTLERIILRALQRDPDQRFQTAEELQAALEGYLMESGQPVLPSQLASLMKGLFAARIQEKEQLLLRCEDQELDELDRELPGLDDQSSSSSMGVPTAGTLERHAMADQEVALLRRRWQLLLALVALFMALGVVLLLVLRDRPRPAPVVVAPKPAPVPQRRITISVRVTPALATVTLDGKSVGNPFETERPATAGTLPLVVAAPGYKAQRLSISLERGGSFVLALERELPEVGTGTAAVAVKKTVRRRPARRVVRKVPATKKPKKKKGSELFGDPFDS